MKKYIAILLLFFSVSSYSQGYTDTCYGTNLMPQGDFEDTAVWFGFDEYLTRGSSYHLIHPYDFYLFNHDVGIWPGDMLFVKNQHYGGWAPTCTCGYDSKWDSAVDHTTGMGWMLHVDGPVDGDATAPTKRFFIDTLSVQPYTNYKFSFFWRVMGDSVFHGGSLFSYGLGPPKIGIKFNGSVMAKTEIVTDDYEEYIQDKAPWMKLTVLYYSNTDTQVIIGMVDSLAALNGNNFVIDDMMFRNYFSCEDTLCMLGTDCDTIAPPEDEIYTAIPPCRDVDNGEISVNYAHLIENYITEACGEHLTYTLQKDNLYNKKWDEDCKVEPAFVHTGIYDTIFDGLSYGDYMLTIKCTPEIPDSCLDENLMPYGDFEDTSYWFNHYLYNEVHPANKYLFAGSGAGNNMKYGEMLFMKNQHYFGQYYYSHLASFDSCLDHTTETGWMLGIYSRKGAGGSFFIDTTEIERCRAYQLKFYYRSIGAGYHAGPLGVYARQIPEFQVKINNEILPLYQDFIDADYDYIDTTFQDPWHEVTYIWNSTYASEAAISITTLNDNEAYFVMDDMSFQAIEECGLYSLCPLIETFISLDPLSYNLFEEEVFYVCPKDTLRVFIEDSSLYDNVTWDYCCGINELDTTKKSDVTDYMQHFQGGTYGGYFYVQAETEAGCIVEDTGFVVDFQTPPLILKEIDSVINVSASVFRSIWKPVYSGVQWQSANELTQFRNKLPFDNGIFGMHRPQRVFDYLDDRFQTMEEESVDVSLRIDGTFNDFKMYDWHHPSIETCVPNWKLNHTITNYNPGSFEIENKDILKRYSSALYSYGGKLEIAVAANASYEEIGFENFEEYDVSDFTEVIHQLNNATGNIDIVPNIVGLRYPYILEFNIEAAYGRYALVKIIEGNLCCDIPLKAYFSANSVEVNGSKNQTIDRKGEILVSETECYMPEAKLVTFKVTDKRKPFPFSNGPKCDRFWTGTLLVEKEVLVYDQANASVSLTSEFAHTGKNSVKIEPGFTSIPQYDLHLKADKNYVVSAWVRSDDMSENPPEQLAVLNKSQGIAISVKSGNLSTALYPSGEVIEGWQRVEGVIRVVEKDKVPSFEFSNTEIMYLDDLRIFPENASIKTFVYDPTTYRLKAELDQNNYATFYQYDDEGNLFSVKKETVEGIKTIQVTQQYLKIKE